MPTSRSRARRLLASALTLSVAVPVGAGIAVASASSALALPPSTGTCLSTGSFTAAGSCTIDPGDSVVWTLKGGNGGKDGNSQAAGVGGAGAKIRGSFANTTDQPITWYFSIGGNGTPGVESGDGGAGGGGGYSVLRTANDDAVAHAIAIAGGGGGGGTGLEMDSGYSDGGNGFGGTGGGGTGGNVYDGSANGAPGGTAGSPGGAGGPGVPSGGGHVGGAAGVAGGGDTSATEYGGGGGGYGAAGGTSLYPTFAVSGGANGGGDGSKVGGGGGGGYAGGGGGGGYGDDSGGWSGAGGGGGSSLIPTGATTVGTSNTETPGVAFARGDLVLVSVSPARVPTTGGVPITLRGAGFDPDLAGNTVLVGGLACTVTAVSGATLTCTLPTDQPAGTVDVQATVGSTTKTLAGALTYVKPAPAGGGGASSAAVAPTAPRTVQAAPGVGSATVSWLPPSSAGSSPVRRYVVTVVGGSAWCAVDSPATSCTVTGLTPGAEYAFDVTASNAEATGPAARSGKVTPGAVSDPTTPATTPGTPGGDAPTTGGSTTAGTVTKAKAKVYFAPLSATLTAEGKKTLKALARRTGDRATKVVVVGYVQPIGGTANDDPLSAARARAVAAYLKSLGMDGRYVVSGYGRADQTGALARRVEVSVSYRR